MGLEFRVFFSLELASSPRTTVWHNAADGLNRSRFGFGFYFSAHIVPYLT